jgi:phage terminase small subunit
MMTETEKPKLRLVASEGSPKQDGDKLTARQERFAKGLSDGLTNSEAYRQAYSTEAMKPSTVHVESCKLAKNPKVAQRVRDLLTAKQAKQAEQHSMLTLKNSDRVWSNVWRLAEGANIPPAVQQSAVALAAKMAGMLTEQVRVENVSSDASAIEKELVERLQKLSKSA